MSFIANEIAQHSDLITIVLANGPYQSLLSYSNSVATWKKYALCDVSFQSIVQFLNVHFLIDAKEAEVIALRLSETFRNFNISIHPSYFAGIPKEMLTRFTEANNRAEIIDLAVTGFLSFFGAGETDEVTLKQRTRRLFLRELAYRNLVLKEPMDLSSVVDFVCDYSAKKDFGIEPVDFINSFVRYGILNSNNNIVDFNIPFIQNYLLAQRLADDPENARRYFDPALGEIDFHTFELYSEIGLSPQVLDAVSNRLDRHISQFGELIGESDYSRSRRADDRSYKENGHILVTGKVRPRFLNGYRKISGHRERLEKLSNDLLSDDSKTESKQRVLDLSDRAREVVTEQKEAGEESGRVNSAQTEIGRDWVMGVIMLGSAAEELDAEIKRELVKKLVSLLALILDDWISSVARIDFEIIKSELSSEMEAHLLEEGEKFGDDHRSFIDMVVDLVEMKELDGPFMSVMHILCEYARNKILLNSVNGVSAEDSVEALVIALWKLELRCDQGIRPLRSALTNLPKDAFLRILVADYLIARAYWYRSENSTRHDYVDGAKESLKPLQLTFDADSILGEKE